MFCGIVASDWFRSQDVKGGIRDGEMASREHSRRETGTMAGSDSGRGVLEARKVKSAVSRIEGNMMTVAEVVKCCGVTMECERLYICGFVIIFFVQYYLSTSLCFLRCDVRYHEDAVLARILIADKL
jgi:hypothetical protein